MTLDTMTLDQIPALTDEEIDRLYAELQTGSRTCDIGSGFNPCVRRDGAICLSDPCSLEPHVCVHCGLSFRVCHPDCPASVLEGLPALVERWTGRAGLSLLPIIGEPLGAEWGGDLTIEEQEALDAFNRTMKYRYLAHACLCAAFAACVALGRKG